MWDQCGFSSKGPKTVRFHINYHSYHTHLKTLGAQLLKQQAQIDCHLDFAGRNILPELPPERACEWGACEFQTQNYQRLLEHCNKHVTGQPRRINHQTVLCDWRRKGIF